MKKSLIVGLVVVCFIAFCSGCSRTRMASDFSGLSTPDGKAIAHLNTSNFAIHILGSQPFVGDATLDTTVGDFTREARVLNAGKVRIVQSRVSTWWFILPPVSFVLTPVCSNVAGDVLQ